MYVFAHPSALDIRVLCWLLEGRGGRCRHAPGAKGGEGRPGSGRRDGTQHLPELDISAGNKGGWVVKPLLLILEINRSTYKRYGVAKANGEVKLNS